MTRDRSGSRALVVVVSGHQPRPPRIGLARDEGVQISVEVVRNPHQLRGTETALTVNCPRQRVGRHPDSSSHTPLLAPRNQTCYTVANRVVHLVDRTGILGKSQYRALRRLHQLGAGDSKHLTWPHYVIALYRRLACPVHLLVLCPTTTVARWAATPIDFGAGTLTPTVIGPDTIPAIAEPDTARELPDLMMLSAMVHHHNRAVLRALTRIFAADIPDHELYDVLSRLILFRWSHSIYSAFPQVGIRPASRIRPRLAKSARFGPVLGARCLQRTALTCDRSSASASRARAGKRPERPKCAVNYALS